MFLLQKRLYKNTSQPWRWSLLYCANNVTARLYQCHLGLRVLFPIEQETIRVLTAICLVPYFPVLARQGEMMTLKHLWDVSCLSFIFSPKKWILQTTYHFLNLFYQVLRSTKMYDMIIIMTTSINFQSNLQIFSRQVHIITRENLVKLLKTCNLHYLHWLTQC